MRAMLIHYSGKIKFYDLRPGDVGYKLYNKLIGADMGEILRCEVRRYEMGKGESLSNDHIIMWIDENGRLRDAAYNNVASMIAGQPILGNVLLLEEKDFDNKSEEEEQHKENPKENPET